MDFPISLAIVLACFISLYETINSGVHVYFDAAVMLTFFLLIGRYLDHRTRAIARSAAQELAALENDYDSARSEGQLTVWRWLGFGFSLLDRTESRWERLAILGDGVNFWMFTR